MWAEGVQPNGGAAPTTYFALAGGPTKIFGPVTVTAYLVGYRSPQLNWNFHPQDPSTSTPTIDGCKGYFNLQIADVTRILNVTVQAARTSFQQVGCPTLQGFRKFSIESFVSHVSIQAYARGLGSNKLLESVEFSGAALEFGGAYMC